MKTSYIYEKVSELVDQHGTRNPFQLLDELGFQVYRSTLSSPKGYSLIANGIGYAGISESLDPIERRIVGAHECGHLILHEDKLLVAMLKDMDLYRMNDKTEYEANLFAAELLLADDEVAELAQMEQSDYFSMAKILYVSPELLSFKLFSMAKRGYQFNVPSNIDSGFLRKK